MSDSSMALTAWAIIDDDCEMRHTVHGSDGTTIIIGLDRKTCELELSGAALRKLTDHCTDALAQMDANYARECPEVADTEGAEHGLAD